MLKPTGKLKKLNSCPQLPPDRCISRLVAALQVDNALTTSIVHRLLSGRPSFLPTQVFRPYFPPPAKMIATAHKMISHIDG